MADKYLTSQQTADRLGISVQYLYMLEKRGVITAVRDLPPFSIKKKVPLKFREEDVEALLKKEMEARVA